MTLGVYIYTLVKQLSQEHQEHKPAWLHGLLTIILAWFGSDFFLTTVVWILLMLVKYSVVRGSTTDNTDNSNTMWMTLCII